MNGFELLSELHDLLARADIRALAEAKHLAGDGPMRHVLDALTRALTSVPSRPREARVPTNSTAAARGLDYLTFLKRPSSRITRDVLIKALRASNIRVKTGSKDGVARVVAKAERTLRTLEADEATRRARKLRRELGINETEGWIDVIRRA